MMYVILCIYNVVTLLVVSVFCCCSLSQHLGSYAINLNRCLQIVFYCKSNNEEIYNNSQRITHLTTLYSKKNKCDGILDSYEYCMWTLFRVEAVLLKIFPFSSKMETNNYYS